VCSSYLRNYVYSVAFDPTGRFVVTGSLDKSAKVWRMSLDGAAATCVATLSGHGLGVYSVAFDPTGRFVATGSSDRTAKVWCMSPDGAAATCVATLEHSNPVWSVAFDPTKPFLTTGSHDGTVKVREILDTLPAPAPAHPRPIPSGFICPISTEIMRDPVICADGHSYDRTSIEQWFATGHNTSPNTGAVLPHLNVVPNHALRNAIDDFI
jgi:WD40 repeat protein